MSEPQTAIPSRQPSATSADDTVLPFEVKALDLRGRVVRLGPAVDTILRAPRLPRAGGEAPRRGGGAGGAARHLLEVRGPVHPADPGRRTGAHAGGRLHHPRQDPRLRPLRRRPRGGGHRRRQDRHRRSARPRPSRADHRPGPGHEPLPGPGRARRQIVRGCRARILPALGADSHAHPPRRRRGAERRGRRCAASLARRRLAGAVPAQGAGARAPARPRSRRRAGRQRRRMSCPRTTPGSKAGRWWRRSRTSS